MSSVPISEEDLKKELEDLKTLVVCPLCPEGNNILKKPIMILPCLHSFCSPCIQAVSESSSSSSSSSSPFSSFPSPCKCPVCRQEFSTSEGGKRGVQKNSFLDSQVDRLEELRKTLQKITGFSLDIELCDVCEPPNKRDASVRCVDCKQDLCEEHQKSHNLFLKTHKVLDISEASDLIISSSSSPSQHLPCSHHPTKELDLMCLKCEVPICSFCLVDDGGHKGHEASPIFKAIPKKKEKLSGLVDSVQDRHKDLDKSLSFIDQMETKIQESMISEKAKILKEMEDQRTKATQQIDQRQEELLNELETKSKAKLDNLTQQRKRLEADLSCLENSVKVSRSFLKNASDDQLSSHLHLLFDQLTRLKEDKNLLQFPVVTTVLDLKEIQSIDLDGLLKGIKLIEIDGLEIDLFTATSAQEVKLCLNRGDNIEEERESDTGDVDKEGKKLFMKHTPLICSIKKKNQEVFFSLIQNNAQKQHCPFGNLTPVQWSAREGQLEMFDTLMRQEFFRRTSTGGTKTDLYWACFGGNLEIAKKIGVAKFCPSVELNESLNVAAQNGHIGVVEFLFENGGHSYQGNEATTTLEWASYNGHTAIVEYILIKVRNPHYIHHQIHDGRNALMVACERGHSEVVKILLAHGADTQIKNNEGKKAIDLTQSQEILDLLQEHDSKKP